MSIQNFTVEHAGRTYTAELVDQFRHGGRPVDRYELRWVNGDGDLEFFGTADCGRSWSGDRRREAVLDRIGELVSEAEV